MAAVTFTRACVTFTSACTGCGACLLTCPTHAIRPDGGRLTAREDLCTRCGECVEICPADAIDLTGGIDLTEGPAMRTVHPIEAESYRRLRQVVDTSALPPRTRDVVERIVHTTADPGWLDDLVPDEAALEAGARALAGGAPLVVDAGMVAAGITVYPSMCLVADQATRELAARAGLTRSAAAIRLAALRLAAARVSDDAVWVIGNAPTALAELLNLAAEERVRPALVIGVPVGYVGAAEAKAALRATNLPSLTNRSARGGSAIAAAAVNALLYGDPLGTSLYRDPLGAEREASA